MTLDRTRLAALGRSLRRTTPPARLRIMYWTVSACALVLLVMLALALHDDRVEAQAVRVCRVEALLPDTPRIIVVRELRAATKAKANIDRAPAAAHKE